MLRIKKLFSIFVIAGLLSSAFSQEAKNALLIANGDYSEIKSLSQPVPEGEELKTALESIGFSVMFVKNANRNEMFDSLLEFRNKTKKAGGIAFFHYGGHAVQIDGKNYLIPVNSKIDDEEQIRYRCVELDEVMDSMIGESNVVVLDSCRNDPFPNGRHRGGDSRGLAAVSRKPKNSIIVYSAEAGETALDGVYTPALIKRITEKGASLTRVLMKVRNDVFLQTQEKQLPGEYGQLLAPIYLAGKPESENSSENYSFLGFISVSVITPCAVYIDDEYKSDIGEFGSSVFNVPAGRHKVKVIYDDKKTEEREILVKESDTEKVEFNYLSDAEKESCYNKGKNYFYGKNNAVQNYERAVYYYRLAAETGYADAQNSLGYCYEKGYGVEKDKKLALSWYLKSAENGNVTAMRNAGICYEDNNDFSAAEEWYNKAKEAGYKDIQKDIDRIERRKKESQAARKRENFQDFLDDQIKRTGFSIGLVDFRYCRNAEFFPDNGFFTGFWPCMAFWGPFPNFFIGASFEWLSLIPKSSSFVGFLGANYTISDLVNLYVLGGYGYGVMWETDNTRIIRAGIGADLVGWNGFTFTAEYSLDFYFDLGFMDRFFVGLGYTFGR